MVHFTRYSPAALFHSRARCTPRGVRVTPFGNLRITGYVLLPAAFRSLSRPSSPCGSTGIRHGPTSRLTILPSPGDPSPGAFIICPFLPSSCQTSRPALPCGPAMEIRGLEPLTLGLQSRCSSQLSYAPKLYICLTNIIVRRRRDEKQTDYFKYFNLRSKT